MVRSSISSFPPGLTATKADRFMPSPHRFPPPVAASDTVMICYSNLTGMLILLFPETRGSKWLWKLMRCPLNWT
jgi:hypothetical protein